MTRERMIKIAAAGAAAIAVALWDREDESAVLSPLPDRREVFAAEGPEDDIGACICEHDFEPGCIHHPLTVDQVRLVVDADLP